MHKIRDQCGERFWPPDFTLQQVKFCACGTLASQHNEIVEVGEYVKLMYMYMV